MSTFSVQSLTRRVDLFTLRLFLTVVDERQIRRAAIRENIAASAATKRVQDLESVAGVQLFERVSNGVVPSAAGEVLAKYLRQLFDNLEDMRRELSEFSQGVRGHVSIGATGATIIQYLAREFGQFTRDFPLVELDVIQDANINVVRAVVSGSLDLGVYIMTPDLNDEPLDSFPYRTDRLVAVVPLGNSLAEQMEVGIADLITQPFIAMPPHTTLMSDVNRAASTIDKAVQARFTVSHPDVARSLVGAGLGITVLPECLVPVDTAAQSVALRINEPWAIRAVRLGTRRGKAMTAATRALIHQLTEQPENASSTNGGFGNN
ncbi:LysR family transcriptional regulator [Paraburkholderia sp.]|uniref:LysR family transcriptional regulator n=1 Tax=Paraburkholderia sp. TaxID=1926495 RepID=UPI0039E544B2